MITDMTVGSPRRILFRFCLPMLASVAFQQFYGMVDSIVVGKCSPDPVIADNAVAAVGVSVPVTLVFMAIATGANIGCSVLISQLFGAKNYRSMRTAVHTSVIAVLTASLLLTAAGLIFARPLLELLGTPPEIMADSLAYLNIYTGSLFFLFLYNICTGVFTALGDSKTPLYFLIFSSLTNIALDLLFVLSFGWGVSGVAWATFIAQTLSAILSFFALNRRLRRFSYEGKAQIFSAAMLKKVLVFAVPSILQQSFVAVGNLAIQSLINGYGASVIAGFSAALKLNTFAVTCYTTVSGGVSSFTAQNIGARRYERVPQGFRAGVFLLLLLVTPDCARVLLLCAAVGRPDPECGQHRCDRGGRNLYALGGAVLLCDCAQNRHRRHPARLGRAALFHDLHLYRPCHPRGALVPADRQRGLYVHRLRVGDRLGGCRGAGRALLPARRVEKAAAACR